MLCEIEGADVRGGGGRQQGEVKLRLTEKALLG